MEQTLVQPHPSQSVNQQAISNQNGFEDLMEKRALELQTAREKNTPHPAEPANNALPPIEAPTVTTENTEATPGATTIPPPRTPSAEPTQPPAEFNENEVLDSLGLEERGKEGETIPEDKNTEEIEVYKNKSAEYDRLLEDKEIKAILEAKKTGKSVFDFVKEIQGDDYSKLSAKELFELDLNRFNLNEEAKDIEREKFNGMLVSQQDEIGNKIKQGLDQKRSVLLEQYKSNTEGRQQLITNNAQKGFQRLEELKQKKNFNNLEITPERWNKIEDYVKTNAMPNQNLEYDVDKVYRHAIYDLFDKELIMANIRKANTQGRVEVLKEVTRPSMETHSPTTTPPATESKKDEKEKAAKEFREQQNDQFKIKI